MSDDERIEILARSLAESDYKDCRDFFTRIAKSRYREGFALLKKLRKVPNAEAPGEYTYEIRFNEVVIMLIQYLQIEFEGKDPDLRDAVFIRIMEDIVAD